MDIEILADVKTELGEGPLWDVESQRLHWIDSTGRRVFRCTADGRELRTWEVPDIIGSMALRKNSGAIVSLANGFYFLDFDTGETAFVVDPEPDQPRNRLNDGKVDTMGRFVVGSMDTGQTDAVGALHRLDPDLSVHRIDAGFVISNGPCWSPDGATFYFADSMAREIWAYDYDMERGIPSNRRTFATIGLEDGGVPDGSTVDAEGYVWNAQVFDGKLMRYAPDGTLDRTVEMPVLKTTSLTFGGPNLDVLFVTSMGKRHTLQMPADPIARGSVFAVHGLGVQGCPEPRFGG